MKLSTDEQKSILWGAGTLGMCKVTKSSGFPSVARIRVVNLHWKTAWTCWKCLLTEQFDEGKQSSVPISREKKEMWGYFRCEVAPRQRFGG